MGLFVLLTLIVNYVFDIKVSKSTIACDQELMSMNHRITYLNGIMFDYESMKDMPFYNASSFFKSQFIKLQQAWLSVLTQRETRLYQYAQISIIIDVIRIAVVFFVAVWRFRQGLLQISDFLLFTAAIEQMTTAVWNVLGSAKQLYRFSSMYESVAEYENLPSENDMSLINNYRPIPNYIHNITFENVTFIYPNQKTPALEKVSFTITGDETVAIVGENGAGKSTLVSLLLRLYEPTSGCILMNGHNVNEYHLEEYRQCFSTVFQDFNMYALTVGENITFSNQIDTVWENLRIIGLDSKIRSLPKGLNMPYTQMFEKDGIRFSGGEEQKLAICRGLSRENAKIIIMDEPTSNIDPISEFDFNNMICTNSQKKQTIFISHRFSTTQFCDKILVFDNAHLVETGSHNTLMKKDNGLYQKLYKMQVAFYQLNKSTIIGEDKK